MTCGRSREPNTENTGLMESLDLHSTRERQRERERVKHKTLFKDNNTQSVHSMCLVNTFIQVLYGLTEVLTVLQCSLKEPLR
mgnify:FL=1